MVTITEKELKRTLSFLSVIKKEKQAQGIATPNLDDNISYLEKEFEEQRMMNK